MNKNKIICIKCPQYLKILRELLFSCSVLKGGLLMENIQNYIKLLYNI